MAGLAPDAPSLAAARRLARPGPWSDTGSTETLLWGKCQGSGKTPYQVSIDLTGPAFRCSCPSRKLPCKHGLALLLLWVDGVGSVTDADEAAGFAQDWAAERAARVQAKAAGDAARPARTPDPAAAAKRLEERLALMDGGMDDFARWLTDLARSGTASARHQPYTWWDGTAARLVDAQLPGHRRRRALGRRGGERPSRLGGAAARCHRSVVDGDPRLGRARVAQRGAAGRPEGLPRLVDEHRVGASGRRGHRPLARPRCAPLRRRPPPAAAHLAARQRDRRDRAGARLRGRRAGAARGARVVGSSLDATVARYPGAAVRRALFVDEPAVSDEGVRMPSGSTLEDARSVAARAGGSIRGRAGCRSSSPTCASASTASSTPSGASVSLTDDADVWSLLALTGGRPARVFGELEESRLRPLTVVLADEVVGL